MLMRNVRCTWKRTAYLSFFAIVVLSLYLWTSWLLRVYSGRGVDRGDASHLPANQYDATFAEPKPVVVVNVTANDHPSHPKRTAAGPQELKVKSGGPRIPALKPIWPPVSIPSDVLLKRFPAPRTAGPCNLRNLGDEFVPWSGRDLKGNILSRFEVPLPGGYWYPHDCSPHERIAIMVPYRNRSENREVFNHHMHYFMQKQMQNYVIIYVEQTDRKKFNRAKLFNVGYVLSQMMYDFTCYILHDVDKMPEDSRYLYSCKDSTNHMLKLVRQASQGRRKARYSNGHIYQGYYGGVTAISTEHYAAINGMINSYWGWGAEDDEFFMRLVLKRVNRKLETSQHAKFVVLYHKPDAARSGRGMPRKQVVRRTFQKDGLNSLHFHLVNITYNKLYTSIFVEL